MAHDRDLEACRRFYAKGGYTKAPSRLQDIELALWGSQNFADGGAVQELGDGGKFGVLRSYLKGYKDLFDRPVSVAFDEKVFPKILEDQRFKSQFEVGHSNGSYDPDTRAMFEENFFGHPRDLPPHERPIYGHIADRTTPGMASGYGSWNAVLHPSVNERATFTLGDSLGFEPGVPNGPYKQALGPQEPFNKDKFKKWLEEYGSAKEPFDPTVRGFADAARYGSYEALPGRYIEAQIHGGLPWDDVNALVHKRDGLSYPFGSPNVNSSSLNDELERFIAKLTTKADIGNKPTYGYYNTYTKDSDIYPQWLRVRPNHSYEEIPTSALSEIGYADGGLFKGLREYIRGYSQPIKAYHGSPHDFDKFDSKHIGKGEGAQVYGHGMYFAENPEVAKWYRDTLAPRKAYDPDYWTPELRAQLPPSLSSEDYHLYKTLGQRLRKEHNLPPVEMAEFARVQDLNRAREDALERLRPKARLYEVDIHQDPSNFLSLDAPFVAQGPVGQRSYDALSKLDSSFLRNKDDFVHLSPKESGWLDSPEFAKEALNYEIPGVKYWDQMSRTRKAGTNNYVVYPGMDDIIEITNKYADGGQVEGYDKGGLFRWVKGLVDTHATHAEKKAVEEVRDWATKTGNEMLIVGDPYAGSLDNALRAYGTKGEVDLPKGYVDYMKNQPDVFSAHPHPNGGVSPSQGDIGIWANNNRDIYHLPDATTARQKMWIAGIQSPNDVSVIEQAPASRTARNELMTKVNDLFMRGGMMPWDKKDDYRRYAQEFVASEMPDIGFGPQVTHNLSAAYPSGQAGNLIPLYMDPDAKVNAAFPYLTSDIWPAFTDYLKKKDFVPYADGGVVNENVCPYNMGEPSDLELGYASQFFSKGGKV